MIIIAINYSRTKVKTRSREIYFQSYLIILFKQNVINNKTMQICIKLVFVQE